MPTLHCKEVGHTTCFVPQCIFGLAEKCVSLKWQIRLLFFPLISFIVGGDTKKGVPCIFGVLVVFGIRVTSVS